MCTITEGRLLYSSLSLFCVKCKGEAAPQTDDERVGAALQYSLLCHRVLHLHPDDEDGVGHGYGNNDDRGGDSVARDNANVAKEGKKQKDEFILTTHALLYLYLHLSATDDHLLAQDLHRVQLLIKSTR